MPRDNDHREGGNSRPDRGRPPRRDARPPRADGPPRGSRPPRADGPARDARPPQDRSSSRADGSSRSGGSSSDGRPGRSDRPARDGRPSRADSGSRDSRPARPDRSSQGRPRTGAPRDGRQGETRPDRPPRRDGNTPGRVGPPLEVPELPDEVTFDQLDKSARARLRTLSKDNAEDVGRHLVMAGKMLDIDPEVAYKHAQVASARGGRVDVVREAAAVTAYATGRYAEALKELRTVRRLSGMPDFLPLMADCERGLGRPERAIALENDPDASRLDADGRVELRLVIAGARLDMGEAEAAHAMLARLSTDHPEHRARIAEARAQALRALGRTHEAEALEATLAPEPGDSQEPDETWADEVVLYDVQELAAPDDTDAPEDAVSHDTPADPPSAVGAEDDTTKDDRA